MPYTAGRIGVAASFAILALFVAASPTRTAMESPATTTLFAAAFLPIYWVAAALAYRANRTVELDHQGRRAWTRIAAANGVLALNNCLFFFDHRVADVPAAGALVAVWLPLLWYAAMLPALAWLTRAMESGLERSTFWLDAATVLCSGILILIYVFVHTPGQSSTASPVTALATIVFPALNGAVIFAAVAVLLRPGPGVSRVAIGLLAGSVALMVVGDLAYGRAAAVGGHRPGIWYEPVYLLAACLSAAAALAQLERPGEAGGRQFDLVSTGSSLVPYAAVIGAVTVVILEVGDRWRTPLGTMVIGAVLLTGLVMARQLVSRRHLALLAAAEQARLTRQAALELQLQQAQKLEAVGLLAGGIAHDFNNILAAIRGTAELAATAPESVKEDMDEIVRAVDHGASLTRQLLAFGRRDAVQVQRFDLRALVGDMDAMLRRVVTGEVLLRVSLPSHPVIVEMDRGQAEQVLLNLVINARDAMPGGGTLGIDVSARMIAETRPTLAKGAYATLTVSDNGHGMPPEVVSRMFEPFYTTKPRGRGSGLGLSTVYAIVSRAGGTIDVKSAVGQGTVLEILLPLATSAEEQSVDAARAPDVAESFPGREVVLVVDDEPTIRDLVGKYLSRNGYTVISAADGAEALARLSTPSSRIDLMITDLTMPGMSGHTLIEHARTLHPRLPVICMSGYAEPETTAAVAGANYIEKPFNLTTFGRLVRSTLDV